MIIERANCFFEWFKIAKERQTVIENLAQEAAFRSEGMTHYKDYLALGALLEFCQPKAIFEIGTYLGITADFFLQVLPNCKVTSIAYVNPKKKWFSKKYNNSELSRESVGQFVGAQRKDRFLQLIGDSHQLSPENFLRDHGSFDFVFIDGDHSAGGVKADTHLAMKIINPNATLAWHDANPKQQYFAVRKYLEKQEPLPMLATEDEYIGGIACWNSQIEEKLKVIAHV